MQNYDILSIIFSNSEKNEKIKQNVLKHIIIDNFYSFIILNFYQLYSRIYAFRSCIGTLFFV